MAKLSSRGRTELVRLTKLDIKDDPKSLASESRTTVALMSDRTILEKRDVVFRADGKRHSYGWKVFSKVKEGVTPERFVEAFTKLGFVRA
jgi:hypothetical protein